MCGIAGFLASGFRAEEATVALRRMTDAIRHRGPDDAGQWLDSDAGIALGHRRLSILDLSPEGHQPMVSASGRYVITFNGEIYNWQELRKEEEAHGVRFRGHSDTEVMLAAIERLGLVSAVQGMAGMFAFALWDRSERALHLVRDRIGEKPLYYGAMGDVLLFGSELKSLQAHPSWRGTIDREALALYLRYNYVPAPYSIFTGIRKVEAATIVRIGPDRAVTETRVLGHGGGRPAWIGESASRHRRGDCRGSSKADSGTRFERKWSPTCLSARSSAVASIRRSSWP